MKLFCTIIFQCVFIFSFAQSVEVVKTSAFKHNYLVAEAVCLEDLNDTSKINFIAQIKISDSENYTIHSNWHTLLKAKAKILGANLYYVENYSESETGSVAIIKLFFSSVKFVKENKEKANKNAIYVFNFSRLSNDTASFYLNQNKINFDPKKYYKVITEPFKLYKLSLHQKNSRKKTESFPRDKESAFYILPVKASRNYERNKPGKCNYSLGRFLFEIYKQILL